MWSQWSRLEGRPPSKALRTLAWSTAAAHTGAPVAERAGAMGRGPAFTV